MTQYEAVIQTIENLGGIATLGLINQHVFEIKDCQWKSKTPFASIRRIVRNTPGIYRIKPGLYALESHRKELEANGFIVETAKNATSKTLQNFTHAYYQGLLIEIGNMKGLDTFVPNQDKGKHYTQQLTLGQMRSIQDIPPFSYENLVQRSSTIDVIWFNKRKMPSSFFEVEHSTDIQNSLLKYVDLQDFNVRMVIVADEKRKQEFTKKLGETAFSAIAKRVKFLNYKSLELQYNQELIRKEQEFLL